MSMETSDKIMFAFALCFVLFLASIVAGLFIFNTIEAKQKDRELSIREREIELKSEQYPYKSETKVEVHHE